MRVDFSASSLILSNSQRSAVHCPGSFAALGVEVGTGGNGIMLLGGSSLELEAGELSRFVMPLAILAFEPTAPPAAADPPMAPPAAALAPPSAAPPAAAGRAI